MDETTTETGAVPCTTNVVQFPKGSPYVDLPIERVMQGALEANLAHIVIVGRRENGEWYNASSSAHIPSVLWMLECARSDLLRM